MQKAMNGMVSMSIIMWWSEDTLFNKEYCVFFGGNQRPRRRGGMGSWPKELMTLRLVYFTDIRILPYFLEMATMGLAFGEVEC